jgi:hypothetical protein
MSWIGSIHRRCSSLETIMMTDPFNLMLMLAATALLPLVALVAAIVLLTRNVNDDRSA